MKIEFLLQNDIGKYSQPVPAKRIIPSWYKNLESEVNSECSNLFLDEKKFTIKKCMPVMDMITAGYIIPLHMEIEVRQEWDKESGEKVHFEFTSDGNYMPIGTHSKRQMPHVVNGYEKPIFKFISPFSIKTPPGYSCMFFQPFYHFEPRFDIFPGIVDTDLYNEPINFPFMMKDCFEPTKQYLFEIGTPLVQILPFKRDKWRSIFGAYNPASRSNNLFRTAFKNVYARYMHKRKKFN